MSIILKLSCKKHPRYKMVRRSDCPACHVLYVTNLWKVTGGDLRRLSGVVDDGTLKTVRL